MPDHHQHIHAPALSGHAAGEMVVPLGVPFAAGVSLAPVPAALAAERRAVLGGGARLVSKDEAAAILARWIDEATDGLRPAADATSADKQAADRLLADGRGLAAGPADDDAAAAIEGYRARAAEMAAAAERRPAPRRLRHVEALRRLDPGVAPLVAHPAVRAALARLDAATGALAGGIAALRQARDELAGLAEQAARKRGDRIARLEAQLERARRKPGLDRDALARVAAGLGDLARQVAELAGAAPLGKGEPT